jgi:iron(III) transport system permease protein
MPRCDGSTLPGRSLAAAFRQSWEEADLDRWLCNGLLLGAVASMLLFILLPLAQLLSKSLLNARGEFVGAQNFLTYFRTPALFASLTNSLLVAGVTTLLSTGLGFVYAYALTRTTMPGRAAFRGVAMLPLFAPTLLYGIALVYLFGRKGLVTTGCFGWFERVLGIPLALDIGLYGPVGIILAETLFTFPQAVLILAVAFRMTDARLYEAADSLQASGLRTFLTVTVPGVKYGLLSAVFVCFILAFTDFGAPKVVGGNFNVLATDIYKQVIGQQNFTMGATVSVVLLVPTVIAFLLDRVSQRRQVATIQAKSVPLVPRPQPVRDWACFAACLAVALPILAIFCTAAFASLITIWPYDLRLSWRHYGFGNVGGGGYAAFWTSLRMSAYTALVGTAVTFAVAYLIEKGKGIPLVRQAAYFLAMLPLALPGMVIGLAFIFFFNMPGWTLGGITLPNPLHGIYGTMAILVASNIVHFFTVSFLTATTALKQLDREFESVAESMAVPFYVTFGRVTAPICLPAILEIGMYYFVNAMATLSAVIFLYSADLPLATVAVANMDDAGDIAPAAAMATLIVAANIGVRLLYEAATRGLTRRTQAWIGR